VVKSKNYTGDAPEGESYRHHSALYNAGGPYRRTGFLISAFPITIDLLASENLWGEGKD